MRLTNDSLSVAELPKADMLLQLQEKIQNHELYKKFSNSIQNGQPLDWTSSPHSFLELKGGGQVNAGELIDIDYDTMLMKKKYPLGKKVGIGTVHDYSDDRFWEKAMSEGLEASFDKDAILQKGFEEINLKYNMVMYDAVKLLKQHKHILDNSGYKCSL